MFSGIKRFLHYSLVLVLIDGRYVKHPKGRDSVLYARPNVTKCQVYQFFMSTKNLHIKSFTLLPIRQFFYVEVKIYTTSLLHCYQLPIFFNESTYLLIKFLALISSFMLNFKARSFQTARALSTGSSPGLLDL